MTNVTTVRERISVSGAGSPAGEAMDRGTTALLRAPAVDHIIERPRLISILEESDARTIGFLAPAGYGKTTLARQWCERQSSPIAWYRTSRMSGDVAALSVGLDTLFAGVVEVPDRDPRRIGSIASVNPTPPPLSRAFVSTYKRHVPRDLLLVLDEWEAAGTEEADVFMGAVLEELDVKVLVTSRIRPPWFTARRQIYGEALEIGAEQLAMTDAEAIKVIAGEPEADTTKTLLATARGWPAVLGLAAIQTNRRLPKRVRPEALYEFLATDLLGAAPARVRDGLRLLAISATRDVSTAATLLGEETEQLLDQAEKLALLGRESKATFSIHPLLRELMVASAADLPDEARAQLAESLRPLIAAERWEEALAGAEVVADGDFTIDALRQALPELLDTGRLETLRRWVEVGRATRAGDGLVDYAEGEVAVREGDYERAIALGELAAERLKGDEAARAHLLAGWGANLSDRAPIALEHLTRARTLATSTKTQDEASWRTLVQALDDELPDVASRVANFSATCHANPKNLIRGAIANVRLANLEGGMPQSLSEAEIAGTLTHTVGPLVASAYYNLAAACLALLARYDESLEAGDQVVALADQSGIDFIRMHGLLAQARALIGVRQIGLAQRKFAELDRRLTRQSDVFVAANLSLERARLYITVGDLNRALATLGGDLDERLERGIRGEILAMRSLVQIALNHPRKMRVDADNALAVSRTTHVRGLVHVAECFAEIRQRGGSGEAVEALFESESRDAVVLAYRADARLVELVAHTQRRDDLVSLLRTSRDAGLARLAGVRLLRQPRQSARLSPRELEIHELIAQGLTNPEIAKLLFISESTTKVHVKHILEKLGVRSRVEAARVWDEIR